MRFAVVSLRFAPGHIAHLRAYQCLFSDLGCNVHLFLDEGYKQFLNNTYNITYINNINEIISWNPDAVLSYNISSNNITLAKKCKRNRIKFYYILHEPWDTLKELISLGKRMPRRIVANVVNYLTAHYSYKVVLASENGKQKYLKHMKGCNLNYSVFPLIFCDDYDKSCNIKRTFFSFIGGFTVMRGCLDFLNFVKFSIETGLNIHFCIATRSNIATHLNSPLLRQAINEHFLTIFAGSPMTTEEINQHYRESICTWNAYKSSTQSGVLPNALMQGTPVLITNRGDSKNIVEEKREACFVSPTPSNDEIRKAFDYIQAHIVEMSEAARQTFLNTFDYSKHLSDAKDVYEIF